MSNIPHRFREDQFRRYEKEIIAAVINWPIPVLCNAGALSQVTYTNRLRDAKTSWLTYEWTSDLMQVPEAKDKVRQLIVAERDGKILFGTKEAVEAATKPIEIHGNAKPETALSTLAFKVPTLDALKAIACLLHHRLLEGPIELTLTPAVDAQSVLTLPEAYDVAIDPCGGDRFMIT